jgi:uncharacterized repeat protein (TIGR01451 family)/MYXO-CTERM domain-containing protein
LALTAGAADAATLRFQVNQRGDFVLFGNTVGQDCGNAVPQATLGTRGACGNNTTDTAPDIYWRSDDATNTAAASTAIAAADARSTAMLAVPAGANITYARLYWSAATASATGAASRTTVTVDRVGTGAFSNVVTADLTPVIATANSTNYYQSTSDVTALVQAHGVGAYRVSNIDALPLLNLNSDTVYIGWSMVVFYELDSDPPRNLTIFDGLDTILSQGPSVTVNLSGFLVPVAGFDAKLGVIAYEGDNSLTGDSMSFNGTALSNALNPVNNFFNSSRSKLGVAVSNVGDLPQVTGAANSMSSFDLDVVNVTPQLHQGDTSATITASTSQDFYLLGAFITSISTFKPDFGNVNKSVVDLTTHPGGLVFPGDVIQYTIVATNEGNDGATNVVLNDVLPAGLTFVPGSIQVTAGNNIGAKTDATGDDQGEYLAASRTIRVRLGAGATGAVGGTVAIGGSSTVAFRATVDTSAAGRIENQAIVTASGASGAPPADYLTQNSGGSGMPAPTPITVDKCGQDTDCNGATPFCLTTASPKICIGCRASTDCSGATPTCDPGTHQCHACTATTDCATGTPVCLPTGACGQCSATEQARCTGATPACNVASSTCVECVGNSTCGAGAPICDTGAHVCVGCLLGSDCAGAAPVCDPAMKICRGCGADNECGGATPACQPGGSCGQCSASNGTACTVGAPVCEVTGGTCVTCVDGAQCGGNHPVCSQTLHVCQGCTADGQCGGATPACQASGACGTCSGTNATTCTGATPLCDTVNVVCVGCLTASDCSGNAPVCDGGTRSCRGCAGSSDCSSATPVCVPSGACHECAAGNSGACAGARPLCDTATDHCVGCLAGSDCAGAKPICDGGNRTCRGCSGDGECGGGTPACQTSGACGECSATNTAACGGLRRLCDVAGGGVCVGCVTSSDCSGPTPFCSSTTHACIPCTADGAPSCGDPARPVCQTTGPLAGACTECSATNVSLCGGAKPRCVVGVGLCGCSDTGGDSDCGGAASGLVCNGPVGICVPGCSAAPNRNGCPTGQTCSDVTGAIGTCSPVGGCTINGDCLLPTTACNTSVDPHQCVQCLGDGACALPLVCSSTAHVCVECTPTNTTACQATGSGSQCLTSGTCGCQVDVDCGGLVSGRICDVTLHKCTVGCRGSGGNGCPIELTCTSSTATPGQCTMPSDGGADGASGADGGVDSSDGGNGGDGARGDDGGGTDGASNDSASGGDGSNDLPGGDGAFPGDTLADANRDGLDGAGDGSPAGDLLADRADGVSSDLARDSSGDGTSGDGARADTSRGEGGPSADATTDQPFGDAAINSRILNLAGGGCQCTTAGDAPTPWFTSLFALLGATLIRRRRRR